MYLLSEVSCTLCKCLATCRNLHGGRRHPYAVEMQSAGLRVRMYLWALRWRERNLRARSVQGGIAIIKSNSDSATYGMLIHAGGIAACTSLAGCCVPPCKRLAICRGLHAGPTTPHAGEWAIPGDTCLHVSLGRCDGDSEIQPARAVRRGIAVIEVKRIPSGAVVYPLQAPCDSSRLAGGRRHPFASGTRR